MGFKKADVKFVGVDDWSRLVFKHEPTGIFLCSVDRLQEAGDTLDTVAEYLNEVDSLHVKSPARDFEGEPSHPVPLES